ncbi:MAG: hypothetical protein RLW62_10975 [Gammaproteobacteria bacterium]
MHPLTRSLFVLVAALVAAPAYALVVPPTAPLEYVNQDSAQTFYHSGIVTKSGATVWDTDFARLVNTGIGTHYNEIAFAFMQCYGGGMIDELGALDLVPASYTSAARHDEAAWVGSRDTGFFESYYNAAYAPVAGSAVARTHLQAASAGRNGDLVGPVRKQPQAGNPLEHPQYTSSGPIGDSITLHRNNPQGVVANADYLALLYGGQGNNTTNFNSLVLARNELLARGYTDAEIHVMYSYTGGQPRDPNGNLVNWVDADAGAKELAQAWTNVASDNVDADTQVYFWNAPLHGNRMFDLLGWIGGVLDNARNYLFDLVDDFTVQLRALFDRFGNAPPAPLALPHFEIVLGEAVDPNLLAVNLNGMSLALLDEVAEDIFGDGSSYAYRFGFDDQVVASLATSANSFDIAWSGFTPTFRHANINLGDRANTLSQEVPEPPAALLATLALVLFASARARALRFAPERSRAP